MRMLLAMLLALPLGAITLVSNGKTSYSVCTSPNATPAEQFAAREFARFVEEMSGARMPVVQSCEPHRRDYVFIGGSEASDRVFRNLPNYGPEEYDLKTSGKHLLIAGGHPRGTLYGVYTLLDRWGCRWYTRDVSRIPKAKTIEVPELDERGRPAFEYREPFVTEAFEKNWAVRNRTNGNSSELDASVGGKVEYFPFVHSFYSLVPPGKYFTQHPEYFSLIDGARRVERGQLCLTNPDVLRIAVAQVREWIREHPNARILSVSQNDWEGWCECDRCRRVEQEEGGEHSGPILRFVNAIAGEIAKTHPDKLIDTLAYWYSENPPAKVRPRPNVRIRLCPIGVCESHPYEQCPRSAYFVKNLKAWGRITNQLYIWHYNTNFAHYLAPMADFDELAADISLYQRNGVVGIFLEGAYGKGGGGENSELRAYLMARLLWDPRTNVDREIDEFMGAVYGPAAKPMRAYFDLLQREVRVPPEGRGQHLWIFNLPWFPQSFFEAADRHFSEALGAAGNDAKLRERVLRARLPIEYLRMMALREYRVAGDTFAPRDLGLAQTAFRQLAAKLRGYGIRSISEGHELDLDEKNVESLRPWRAVTLENDAWKVTIVPELGGRILRMTHKRSGRELLRIPKPGEGGYPNSGGQVVQAFADYPLRAWDTTWTGVSATGVEAVLAGVCSNGIRIERRIRLDADRVHTEAAAENRGAAPIEVVLETHADLEPGDIDAAHVVWISAAGKKVERRLIRPEEPPAGSETYKGMDVPAGVWTLDREGVAPIVNSFPPELSERSVLSWTAKGGPRVTLGVWSKKRTLAPGERIRIASDYR